MHVHNTFIEETGRTKLVELVNIAQPRIISGLRIGQPLKIYVKRLKIFVENLEKQYIGVLPDDIGNRLISLIKGGNQYEALIRSADNHHVIVFLKEIKLSRVSLNFKFSRIFHSYFIVVFPVR